MKAAISFSDSSSCNRYTSKNCMSCSHFCQSLSDKVDSSGGDSSEHIFNTPLPVKCATLSVRNISIDELKCSCASNKLVSPIVIILIRYGRKFVSFSCAEKLFSDKPSVLSGVSAEATPIIFKKSRRSMLRSLFCRLLTIEMQANVSGCPAMPFKSAVHLCATNSSLHTAHAPLLHSLRRTRNVYADRQRKYRPQSF